MSQADELSAAPPVLEVTDLVVQYGRRRLRRGAAHVRAVDSVSLVLPAGAVLGIVGQSGSGKSSLARAVVGLERPRSGTIAIDGAVEGDSTAALRRRRRAIQMVFQDSLSSLNPHRSIGSTLSEPLAVGLRMPRAKRPDRVAELLVAVGLSPDMAGRRPSQLSGGQRQRVNIARALASEPKVIIADEPTSALDVSVRAQVLDLLLGLQRSRGLSLLFISHDLHVIRHVSDEVLVMRRGEVVERGTTDAIYDAPAHEYTRSLLAAAPTIDAALAESGARGRSAF